MEDLLAQGADLECENDSGQTALHLAAAAGNREVVQWLLDRGANLASSDRSRTTVIEAAAPAVKDLLRPPRTDLRKTSSRYSGGGKGFMSLFSRES